MVGGHPDIAVLHEETSLAMTRILGKTYTGVKLCVPNHIRLSQRGSFLYRHIMKIRGLRRIALYMVESKYSIRDYQRMFPELHVLMIVRAPDQVVSSIRHPRGYAMYCYRHALHTMWQLLQEDAHDRTRIINFDSLVTEPERVMRALCTWLNCDFRESMLEGYKFTPQYDRPKIDPSRASGGRHLAHLQDDAAMEKMYLDLVRRAI